MFRILSSLAIVVGLARADVYLHGPRGSNDRNCERNVNRNNGNRMFDSQNNAKGGYACPRAVGDDDMGNEAGMFQDTQPKKMYYYEGTNLIVEWTNQHGCGGNAKAECMIVLQYMNECTGDPVVANAMPFVGAKTRDVKTQQFRSGNNIGTPRDGIPTNDQDAATDTIPDNYDSALANNAASRRFGMHESFHSYELCKRTERNRGLWTADQRVRRNDQRGTRQNPNGNRRGLECPEERDYYPHWSPQEWIDIAVLTDAVQDDEDDFCILGGHSTQGTYDTNAMNQQADIVEWNIRQTGVKKICGGATQANFQANNENGVTRNLCGFFTRNSANVAARGWCEVAANTNIDAKLNHPRWQQRRWPNNREACAALGAQFEWVEKSMGDPNVWGWKLPSVVCGKTPFSRVNQLGNSNDASMDDTLNSNDIFTASTTNEIRMNGVNANRYHWKLPVISDMWGGNPNILTQAQLEKCFESVVLRLRYNDSNADIPQWPAQASGGQGNTYNAGQLNMLTSANNTRNTRNGEKVSPLEQDPYVYMGPGGAEAATNSFLSLALNTNQYARTFQDRSYTFSIKKRPSGVVAADANADKPKVPSGIALAASGGDFTGPVIINVNGRGKRGNIVQTYPAVEYDFIPNQVVCKEGQFLHFQWTGSDYNPRRGCNNGEGGPPDPNNFVSNNDNQNARADRMNLAPLDFMTKNVAADTTGGIDYNSGNPAGNFASQKAAHMGGLLTKSPCYDGSASGVSANNADHSDCYDAMRGLYYLRQDTNPLYQQLRGPNNGCLTEQEIDNIQNKNVRETHPRNCAKLNAAIHPYFDGGLVPCKAANQNSRRLLSMYSTRNNNHSNRDQTAGFLIAESGFTWNALKADTAHFNADYRTLQTSLTDITGANELSALAKSACDDEANANNGAANNNGATSCIPAYEDADAEDRDVLGSESFTREEGDNDAKGDGNANGCEELIFFLLNGTTIEEKIGLAIGLLFVGGFCVWLAYFLWNRYQRTQSADPTGKFSTGKKWNKDNSDNVL